MPSQRTKRLSAHADRLAAVRARDGMLAMPACFVVKAHCDAALSALRDCMVVLRRISKKRRMRLINRWRRAKTSRADEPWN